MRLTQVELRRVLVAAGFQALLWQLPDTAYETVSADWVRDNWEAWLEARPAELVVFGDAGGKRVRIRPLWLKDCGDCDNLALGVVAHGDTGNALAAVRARVDRGGLAFGALFYVAGPARPENASISGPHAINWFVDHSLSVHVFEPGVGEPTNLSSTEKETSWFGLAA